MYIPKYVVYIQIERVCDYDYTKLKEENMKCN